MPCQRRPSTSRKSRTAAPVGLVTNAIRRGNAGKRPFAFGGKQTFGRQLFVQLTELQFQRAEAFQMQLVDDQAVFVRAAHTLLNAREQSLPSRRAIRS